MILLGAVPDEVRDLLDEDRHEWVVREVIDSIRTFLRR